MVAQISHQLLSEALSIDHLFVAAPLPIQLLGSLVKHHGELPKQVLDEFLLLLFVQVFSTFSGFIRLLFYKRVRPAKCRGSLYVDRPDFVIVLVSRVSLQLSPKLVEFNVVYEGR